MSSFCQSSPFPEILFIFHNFAPAHIETKSGPAGKMRTNLWQGANTFIILSLPGAVSLYEKLHLSCHTTYGSYLLYESHYEHYVLIIFDVLGENKQNFRQLNLNVFSGSLQKRANIFLTWCGGGQKLTHSTYFFVLIPWGS